MTERGRWTAAMAADRGQEGIMKIAFATTDGRTVDEHFGRAGMFAIYEITKHGHRFVESRKFAEGIDTAIAGTKDKGPTHDDAVQSKVDRLADC
ncbi:MAG TPA: NifB/NifX family molybdenum-iron cluster-binding protein, partial [Nitrospirota bacterium]|nr:NifB/NifX family molybdenum-iron cluster-binding protein [Nitrospirota bacterium]